MYVCMYVDDLSSVHYYIFAVHSSHVYDGGEFVIAEEFFLRDGVFVVVEEEIPGRIVHAGSRQLAFAARVQSVRRSVDGNFDGVYLREHELLRIFGIISEQHHDRVHRFVSEC